MGKKVTIHIGMQKTGSTSIQKTFYASREILKKYNCYYPETIFENHGASLFSMFTEHPETYHTNIIQGITTKEKIEDYNALLFNKWIKEFEKCKVENFIISGEDLSLLSFNAVKNFKNFLSQYFDEFQVICYLRDVEEWSSSMVQQLVKEGISTINQDILRTMYPDYIFLIKKYFEVFGRDSLILRVFSKSNFYNNDLIDDFVNVTRLDDRLLQYLIRHTANESLGEQAIYILDKLNSKYPRYKFGNMNHERGQIPIPYIEKIYSSIPDKKFILNFNYDEDEIEKINKGIYYVNNLMYGKEKLKYVSANRYNIGMNEIETISNDFLIELINEYNKVILDLISRQNNN